MTAKEIIIGQVYLAKVSGRLTTVRIDRGAHPYKGWYATNTVTERTVRIVSAARLRKPILKA